MSNSPKIWRRTQSGAAAEIQVLSARRWARSFVISVTPTSAPLESKCVPNLAGLRLSATAFALVNLSTWLSRRNRVSKSLAAQRSPFGQAPLQTAARRQAIFWTRACCVTPFTLAVTR
jgi:hypothetical protein